MRVSAARSVVRVEVLVLLAAAARIPRFPAAHTERSNLADGLITSLARPRGNVTGAILDTAEVTAKRLELLKEALPGLRGARGSLALTANNVTYGLLGERLGARRRS